LWQAHKIPKDKAKELLSNSSSYRQKVSSENVKIKQLCPVNGCDQYIIRLSDHLRRKHKTSATKLGIVRKQRTIAQESILLPGLGDSAVSPGVSDSADVRESSLINIAVDQRESTEQCHGFSLINSNICRYREELTGILDNFKIHMESMDAGRKKYAGAYRLSCKQIIDTLGGSISALAKDAVTKLYVQPLVNANPLKISMQTLCTKLIHLEHFCKYLRDSDLFSKEIIANAVVLIRVLPSWRQSYKDDCNKEAIARLNRNTVERITAKHIAGFSSSFYAKSAHALLLKYDKCLPSEVDTCHTSISSHDFVRCRNYLIATLCINNAHRTGVFANFYLSDYNDGVAEHELEPENHDGDIVFTVVNHKTASTHGAATFSVNGQEYPLLSGYIKMRNKFVSSELDGVAAPLVFITKHGGKLTQSLIASCLTKAFDKSGYKRRVTCTKLRKSATTLVFTTQKEHINSMASHMLHRPATQQKHYYLIDKKSNTVASTRLLRNAYQSAANKAKNISTVNDNSACDSFAPVLNQSGLAMANHVGIEPVAVERNRSFATEMQPSTSFTDAAAPYVSDTVPEFGLGSSRSEAPEPDPQDSPDRPYKKKIFWSIENKELVKAKFVHMVRCKLTPIDEIRQILSKDPVFVQKLEKDMNMTGKNLEVALRGKIRSFFRNH